jgi:hypothetical protein
LPALLSPPDDTLTTTQVLTLTWQAGPGGRPEAYNLELDGLVITTTQVAQPTVLSPGAHTWRVRAFNDAGYSGSTDPRRLEIVEPAYHLHLPLILRNR